MGQQSTIDSGNDVVSFLKAQHQRVKGLFSRVLSSKGEAREEAFFALRRLMAIHETAEEEIVHPAARRALQGGEAVVAARLREENEAKTVLSELETIDVDSAEFETKLRKLQSAVLAHAESEETLEFSRLAGVLDADKLKRMRKAVELAEAIAPTRPHAGIESQAGNMIAGPFAAMVDRTRDALSGKH